MIEQKKMNPESVRCKAPQGPTIERSEAFEALAFFSVVAAVWIVAGDP
jgi:hypothetical protein